MSSKVQVTWTGPGLRMIGETEGGPAVVLDSSKEEYGTHSGLTPMELVLIGLAGCTAMDVIAMMAKQRQPMTNLQVKVEAERAEGHPQVYKKIHLEYVAYGDGIDEKALARAIELSKTKYCSVSAMLSKAAEITATHRIAASPHPYPPGEILKE